MLRSSSFIILLSSAYLLSSCFRNDASSSKESENIKENALPKVSEVPRESSIESHDPVLEKKHKVGANQTVPSSTAKQVELKKQAAALKKNIRNNKRSLKNKKDSNETSKKELAPKRKDSAEAVGKRRSFKELWLPGDQDFDTHFVYVESNKTCDHLHTQCHPKGEEGVLLAGIVLTGGQVSGQIATGHYIDKTPLIHLE